MDYKAEAVYKMQKYIRENVMEEISLPALSAACGYSPWYSYRLFQAYTGHSPSDFYANSGFLIRRYGLGMNALR